MYSIPCVNNAVFFLAIGWGMGVDLVVCSMLMHRIKKIGLRAGVLSELACASPFLIGGANIIFLDVCMDGAYVNVKNNIVDAFLPLFIMLFSCVLLVRLSGRYIRKSDLYA